MEQTYYENCLNFFLILATEAKNKMMHNFMANFAFRGSDANALRNIFWRGLSYYYRTIKITNNVFRLVLQFTTNT